jgi:hypothetical protein
MHSYEAFLSLDKCPGVQMLGHVVVACLVFKEAAKLFSRIAVPFYILISNALSDLVS